MCTRQLVDCITDFVGSQVMINDGHLTRSKYFWHQIRIWIDHRAFHPCHHEQWLVALFAAIFKSDFFKLWRNFPVAENVSATLRPLWSCQPNQARNPIWQHLGRWHPTQYYSRHWVSPLATEHSQTPDINKWGRVFNSLPSTPIILIRLHDNCHSDPELGGILNSRRLEFFSQVDVIDNYYIFSLVCRAGEPWCAGRRGSIAPVPVSFPSKFNVA